VILSLHLLDVLKFTTKNPLRQNSWYFGWNSNREPHVHESKSFTTTPTSEIVHGITRAGYARFPSAVLQDVTRKDGRYSAIKLVLNGTPESASCSRNFRNETWKIYELFHEALHVFITLRWGKYFNWTTVLRAVHTTQQKTNDCY
jgi:hypothetical protein